MLEYCLQHTGSGIKPTSMARRLADKLRAPSSRGAQVEGLESQALKRIEAAAEQLLTEIRQLSSQLGRGRSKKVESS